MLPYTEIYTAQAGTLAHLREKNQRRNYHERRTKRINMLSDSNMTHLLQQQLLTNIILVIFYISIKTARNKNTNNNK